MKSITLYLSFIILLSSAIDTNAETKFVRYKNFLIPLSTTTECNEPKVIISTDLRELGGNEDDDVQSLVHYLASSYRFDTRGIISTPSGDTGKVEHIDIVLGEYYKDLPSLQAARPAGSNQYPSNIPTVQGTNTNSVVQDYSPSLHLGAKLIRDEVDKIVNQGECGPLYILVWGALTDVAIALKGTPESNTEVTQNIRVIAIGAGNIKGDFREVAWEYIRDQYLRSVEPDNDLWLILSGGNPDNDGSQTFRGVTDAPQGTQTQQRNSLAALGCLGRILNEADVSPPLKIGDATTTMYLMNGDQSEPDSPSWGGRFTLAKTAYNGAGGNFTVPQNKSFWSDGTGLDYGRSSITPFVGNDSDPASIYGVWYADLANANGAGCNY